MKLSAPTDTRLTRTLGAALLAAVTLVGQIGCTRSHYRRSADLESYGLVESRQTDPRWDVPSRTVEPAANSRMYVGAHLDCAPKPQDDLAAKCYMDYPGRFDNTHYYSQIPTRATTENPSWMDQLPREPSGNVKLTQPLAIDLSLLHSRDYQTQFENVYLNALTLSGNRFEFDTQWFGGLGTGFNASGEDLGNQRLLTVSDRLGFSRNLAGGGQFATSLANSLFWDFGSGNVQGGSAALVTTFTQPLLRGAFRHVRLENLTQAERNLLYSVRDFARFRRTFYLDVTTSYLSLLTQVQAIRNTRTNVDNLRQNLEEHQVLVALEMVSQFQVDQVFQQYQSGRLTLLAAEQNLAASLDAFRFQLGLPPWVPLEIDESLLRPFELVDPELIQLDEAAQQLYMSLVQYLPPEKAPRDVLLDGYHRYANLREQVVQMLPAVEQDLSRWKDQLDQAAGESLSQDDEIDLQQQTALVQRIESGLSEMKKTLQVREASNRQLRTQIEQYDTPIATPSDDQATNQDQRADEGQEAGRDAQDVTSLEAEREFEASLRKEKIPPEIRAWDALLQDAIGEQLREEIAELFIAQTQIRLFLIDVEPLNVQEPTAITFAHQNRLDLMNTRAVVMDAFRRVEVAADALESDLSVTGGVTLGSDPGENNAFRFDSSANRYTVGAQFDGPLNRLNERNTYRAQQIAYQQASRSFVASQDVIANEVREILRQLKLSRLNFQIARQQLVAATRQVDEAQINLRTGGTAADSSLTLFLLQALQGQLNAKNNLISNWIQYRVQKMRLFTALEMLYLDENGNWINEESGLEDLAQFRAIDPQYFPPEWVPAPSDGEAIEPADASGDPADAVGDPSNEDGPSSLPAPLPSADETGIDRVDPSLQSGIVLPSPPYSLNFGR